MRRCDAEVRHEAANVLRRLLRLQRKQIFIFDGPERMGCCNQRRQAGLRQVLVHHVFVWTELCQNAGCLERVVLQRSLQKDAARDALLERGLRGLREPKLSVASALRALQTTSGRARERWTRSRVRGLHAIEAETRVWRRQHQSVACAWNSEEQMALLRLPAPTVRVRRRRRRALRRRWPSDLSEQALQSFAQRQVLLHSTPISEMRRCRLRQATVAIVADAYRGHASLDMPRLYSRERTPRRSSL